MGLIGTTGWWLGQLGYLCRLGQSLTPDPRHAQLGLVGSVGSVQAQSPRPDQLGPLGPLGQLDQLGFGLFFMCLFVVVILTFTYFYQHVRRF